MQKKYKIEHNPMSMVFKKLMTMIRTVAKCAQSTYQDTRVSESHTYFGRNLHASVSD